MNVAPPLEQTARFRHFSCPECQGALEVLVDGATGAVIYVCRIGHQFTARELLAGKEIYLERLLWATLTTVDELIVLIRDLDERRQVAVRADRAQARREAALRLRSALEQVIAENEPVALDGEESPRDAIARRGGV